MNRATLIFTLATGAIGDETLSLDFSEVHYIPIVSCGVSSCPQVAYGSFGSPGGSALAATPQTGGDGLPPPPVPLPASLPLLRADLAGLGRAVRCTRA